MEIVGLSGYARSGKDEAAKILVEEYGFVRVAFADKLRNMLYALNPIVFVSEPRHCTETIREGWNPISSSIYLQKVIDEVGWDGYKETVVGPEIRRLLQRLGTEAGRDTLWDNIWVDAAFANQPDDAKIVIPDCRFVNEAEEIKRRGGVIVRIERGGIGPANDHISETGLDTWRFDGLVRNDSTLEQYQQNVRNIYEGFASRR